MSQTIYLTYKRNQEYVVVIPVHVDTFDDDTIDRVVEALDDSDDWYEKVVMPTFKKEITESFDPPYNGWVDRVTGYSGGYSELYADLVENVDEFLGEDYARQMLREIKEGQLRDAMEVGDYATVARLAAELNAGIVE